MGLRNSCPRPCRSPWGYVGTLTVTMWLGTTSMSSRWPRAPARRYPLGKMIPSPTRSPSRARPAALPRWGGDRRDPHRALGPEVFIWEAPLRWALASLGQFPPACWGERTPMCHFLVVGGRAFASSCSWGLSSTATPPGVFRYRTAAWLQEQDCCTWPGAHVQEALPGRMSKPATRLDGGG